MFNKAIIFLIFLTLTTTYANEFKTNIFIKCDQNKDNHLDKKEYRRMSFKRFERFDISKDSRVTPTELSQTQLAQLMPKIAIDWFIRNDIDENKIVTNSEVVEASDIKFKSLDLDNNNLLSMKEWLGR